MTGIPEFSRAHCNLCGGERNHVVLHRVRDHWNDPEGDPAGHDTYETLQCAGCNSVKLRYTTTHPWAEGEEETYFPARTIRKHPHWYEDLVESPHPEADSIAELLNEIYVAAQHRLRRSAVLAARALLELVMVRRVGDNGSFAANLQALQTEGLVSRLQLERVSAALEAGHAAMHRGYSPTQDDLLSVLDIVENLVESVYVHERKANKLQQAVPPRSKR